MFPKCSGSDESYKNPLSFKTENNVSPAVWRKGFLYPFIFLMPYDSNFFFMHIISSTSWSYDTVFQNELGVWWVSVWTAISCP